MIRAIDLTGEAYHHEPEDIISLKELAEMLPHNPIIVNIGACFGTSAMAFLEARPDAFVFSVDVKVCEAETEHLKQAHLWQEHRCVRVLGRSQDAGRFWLPESVDLVLVDGAHNEEAVASDIRIWLLNVKRGGIIVFDDYGKPICPAVKPVVDKMMDGYEVILERGDIIAFRKE